MAARQHATSKRGGCGEMMEAAQEDGSSKAASSLRGRLQAYAARQISESGSCLRGCARARTEVDQ
jgi:hypothetical protein